MNQQIMIQETIAGMKKAMRRADDASDSDESIQQATNRGNKLKRKAKYVQEGHLDLAAGPRVYRRRIDFNGYKRHVISRNPPRVDLDGDVFEEEDIINSSAELTEAEEDPYSDIKLETLLRPLTSAAELKTHPSLSIPFQSPVLEEMTQSAQDMVHREYAALWRIKRILTDFRGDEPWMPCGTFVTANDIFLLRSAEQDPSRPSSTTADPVLSQANLAKWQSSQNAQIANGTGDTGTDGGVSAAATEISTRDFTVLPPQQSEEPAKPKHDDLKSVADLGDTQDKDMVEAQAANDAGDAPDTAVDHKEDISHPANGDLQNESSILANGEPIDLGKEQKAIQINGARHEDSVSTDHIMTDATGASIRRGHEGSGEESNGFVEGDDDQVPSHRMTTRARAQATNSEHGSNDATRETSPSNMIPAIHPFFTVPGSALPSKESGLPADLADETRRLLCVYVQKQEEVCRGAAEIYHGLLKALRLRNSVMEWATAEGHVGEMSDGEDWYDKERWGLEDDLKKGEEVEEDDANTTGKKTRNRRAAAP